MFFLRKQCAVLLFAGIFGAARMLVAQISETTETAEANRVLEQLDKDRRRYGPGLPMEDEQQARWALTVIERAYGSDDERTNSARRTLASVLYLIGKKMPEVQDDYRQFVEFTVRLHGADAPQTIADRDQYANALDFGNNDQRELAVEQYRLLLDAEEHSLGIGDPKCMAVRLNLV